MSACAEHSHGVGAHGARCPSESLGYAPVLFLEIGGSR